MRFTQLVAGAAVAALTWKAATSHAGVTDPTATEAHLSHGAVILGSRSPVLAGAHCSASPSSASRPCTAKTVLAGVALGFAFTVASCLRMLVATGVLLGFVLLVMVGESVQELQLAGWLPTTSIGVGFPGFVGLWFAAFPTVEGLAAQAAAALLVIGSYVVAERVRRPTRARALEPAAESAF